MMKKKLAIVYNIFAGRAGATTTEDDDLLIFDLVGPAFTARTTEPPNGIRLMIFNGG